MRSKRISILLVAAALMGCVFFAAPAYFNSLQVLADPVETLQHRIDVLEMQLQELSNRVGESDLAEPLVNRPVPGAELAKK